MSSEAIDERGCRGARDFMSPAPMHCIVCGKAGGARPYWVVEYPDLIHQACRNAARPAFPYDGELRALRALVRELRGATVAAIVAGRELAVLRREWNVAADIDTVKRGREALDLLARRLGRMGITTRWTRPERSR
jgi:hypothetical protein